jgi:nitroimidazol reductase NimA-like FMN-containing flavoprotein (pyridoxamine 5'-phosphate oxidase superfamily)
MIIDKLSSQECKSLLSKAGLARLGCALENQPYVIPIYVAYDDGSLYALATLGQKIEWMRANPKVCVQVDDIHSNEQWSSVVVNGQFQELREPQFSEECAHAKKLLEARHRWWQVAMAERQMAAGDHLIAPLFFRVQIDSMTGLRANP